MRINFELLDLQAFLAVIDTGGFHKAASELHMSQPALTRRIQSLEAAIGTALLERTTRKVSLTAVGRSFEPMARRLLGELEQSIETLTGGGDMRGGLVKIACVPTAAFYFLPRVIERFNAEFPDIRFSILDLSANEAVDSVARGETEFGINFTGSSHPDLRFTPLIDDPFVLACRHDHELALRKRLTWRNLEGQALIGVSRHSGNRQLLDAALSKRGLSLNFFYEVNHLTTSLGLVERGLGIAVLPKLATPPGPHPIIVTRPIGEPHIVRTIGIIERKAGRLSPAGARFRAMLAESWSN